MATRKSKVKWPTEILARAKFEIDLFEKPSMDTCKLMVEEIEALRAKVAELELTLKNSGE